MEQRLARIRAAERESFDLIIIGGGVHGANVCRDAALRGYRVLLLEAMDYASGTSSRSSKMLHGGVRYLETGQLGLVREALHERSVALHTSPHLVRAQQFYFPVIAGMTRPGWQIRIGLKVYDFLAGIGGRAHGFPQFRVVPTRSQEARDLRRMGLKFTQLFSYPDGQMDDARIVVETVVDAAESGAVTLNYANVEAIQRRNDRWVISWRCGISGNEHESSATCLVNAAGPWMPSIDQLAFSAEGVQGNPDKVRVMLSRGVHLLFDVPWPRGGLTLPTGTRGRYYFIWPFFSPQGSHTLVGTTDRETNESETDPVATSSEIDELLGFLARDLPNSGLVRSAMYRTFCGVRVLALPGGIKNRRQTVSAVSRSHELMLKKNYVGLVGGKYTNARHTAQQIVDQCGKFLSSSSEIKCATAIRPLPGSVGWNEESRSELLAMLQRRFGAADDAFNAEAHAAISRFGMRVNKLEAGSGSGLELLFRAQLKYVLAHEQASSLEDILRRRLGVTLSVPTSGLGSRLQLAASELQGFLRLAPEEVAAMIESYKARWP